MKKLLLLFSAIFILIACTEESVEIAEVGEASFSFTEANRNTFSSVISSNRISASTELATQITSAQSSGENPSAILVTIIDSNNEVVIDNQQLTLLSFGNDFVTESIGLDVGDYQITSFSVINDENRIIYATPLQSSQLAQLVSNPLNIPFTVNSNQTTTVVPEVIMVLDTDSPEQFGFVSFSFDVVETQSLFVIANEVVNGIATDIDATYTLTVQNSDFTLSGALESGSNALILPILDDATEITITVTNTTESITQVITASQIANNNASSPLTFFFGVTASFEAEILNGDAEMFIYRNGVDIDGNMSMDAVGSVIDNDQDNADAFDMTPASTIILNSGEVVVSPFRALWDNSELNNFIETISFSNEGPSLTTNSNTGARAYTLNDIQRRLYQRVEVEVGVEYTLTFFANIATGGELVFRVLDTEITEESDATFAATTISEALTVTGAENGGSYQEYSITFVATTTSAVIYGMPSASSAGNVMIDDIEIQTPGF